MIIYLIALIILMVDSLLMIFNFEYSYQLKIIERYAAGKYIPQSLKKSLADYVFEQYGLIRSLIKTIVYIFWFFGGLLIAPIFIYHAFLFIFNYLHELYMKYVNKMSELSFMIKLLAHFIIYLLILFKLFSMVK